MGRKPNWKPGEVDYLQNSWGEITIPGIANKLGRSVEAIKIKAFKLGLGRHLHSGEEITFHQLIKTMNRSGGYREIKKHWGKHGFPFQTKRSIKQVYLVVSIPDFWKWAENNKNLLNFSSFEKNILGPEPAWVEAKRKADVQSKCFKMRDWSPAEDALLKSLLKTYRYTYTDLSKRLQRKETAIKRRIYELDIKEWPLVMDKRKWSESQTQQLIELKKLGYSSEAIGDKIGKSALAVTGKLERINKEKLGRAG